MIRKRNSLLDDETIYRLVIEELAPWSKKTKPGISVERKTIIKHLDRNVTLVIARGLTPPYGFVSFRVEGDALFVDMLALDRNVQNRGLGAELMADAEQYGIHKGCKHARLYVDDTNQKAIRFYTRRGFEYEDYFPSFRCYLLSKPLIGASFP